MRKHGVPTYCGSLTPTSQFHSTVFRQIETTRQSQALINHTFVMTYGNLPKLVKTGVCQIVKMMTMLCFYDVVIKVKETIKKRGVDIFHVLII